MRKIVSLLMWVSALALLWMIMYYRPCDPTWWFQTTQIVSYRNVLHVIVAYGAAFCFAAVGASAFLIPIMMFIVGMCLYYGLSTQRIRAIGSYMIVVLFAAATLCEHYHVNFRGTSAGGAWGTTFHNLLSVFLPFWLIPVSASVVIVVALCYIIGLDAVRSVAADIRYLITRYIALPWKRDASVRAAQRLYERSVKQSGTDAHHAMPPSHDSVASVPESRASDDSSAQYHKPPLSALLTAAPHTGAINPASYELQAKILEEKLEHFGITGKVVNIVVGPVVILFEYQPHNSVPINKIVAREYDLALALQATSFRIIAPIPGKAVVGLEMSRPTCEVVSFVHHYAELFAHDYRLPLLIGVTTAGAPVVLDLASLPHLLVAGSTGSGKSVALHALIVSIISTKSHEETRLILIDPKRLEFAVYADIPHLLFPIVVEASQAVKVLRWVVQEMERRYGILSEAGVTDIAAYRAQGASLPEIVLVVDEWADLMMSGGRDAEQSLVRLAQMARAAGIHLIIATQRPSVDVITGLIKVNIAARIACKVISKVDSRTILDTAGAEKLLGKGDMLLMLPGKPIMRVHGVYISVRDVQEVACYTRRQGKVAYSDFYQTACTALDIAADDRELYEQVLAIIKSVDEISISYLQRKLRIGYNRSARMIDYLEAHGMILPSDGGKTRKVLHSKDI